MKFSADRGTLMHTLAKAQGIADKKGTVSNVLAHVLLESVDDNTIRVKCTDYDVILLTSFPAKVDKGGKIALNARSFYDSLRLWQDATVDVEALPGGNVQCQCGRTKASLMAFDPEDFPLIEKDELTEGITVPARLLAHLAQRMTPFMSDDPSRINLNGMLLKLRKAEGTATGAVITAVATDGHRLAVVEREVPDVSLPFDEKQAIIHRKGVLEMRRLLEDCADGDATLGFAMGEVVICTETTALYVRQIEEEYPNYSGVVPGKFIGELRVNRTELTNAVRIASPIVDTHSQGIRMMISKDRVVISGSRSDLGNVETEVFAEYEGPELTVGYNYRFLLDSLSNVDSEQVILGITGAESPSLLKPEDETEQSLFVIMPMELN
ncbi:MAG: DNA polymerase III subunit beta [Pseudomonadota bacterium]